MISKFFEAVKILRPNTEMIWHEESETMTEEEFNKVLWKTGENETGSCCQRRRGRSNGYCCRERTY